MEKGTSAEILAKKFNCSKATIFRTLHKLGYYYHKKPNYNEVIELFNKGKTYLEISILTKIPQWTIERFFQKNNIRKRKIYINHRKDFDIENIKKDYENQVSIQDICKKYNITPTTFYRVKSKYNIETRLQIYYKKSNKKCNDYPKGE